MSRPRNLFPDHPLAPGRRQNARASRQDQGEATSAAVRGEPLPASVRESFEGRFGADFSSVRVHADRDAGASALALGARAFTVGRDIVFAPGHFAPHKAAGRELLHSGSGVNAF